jgi:hypothetical protein
MNQYVPLPNSQTKLLKYFSERFKHFSSRAQDMFVFSKHTS